MSWFRGVALFAVLALPAIFPPAKAAERADEISFTAHDTFVATDDESPDAQACLDGLKWSPGEFTVAVLPQDDGPHAFVRFPSAVPSGDKTNDLVALEWYAPKNAEGEIAQAPAVIVVHESGSRMEVGRLFAKALYAKGFHAFLIQLPYYGLRKSRELDKSDASRILTVMKQGVADIRRARDAVAVIPAVDARHISLQGTSLGGFVSATAAGMDRCFDQVFIMLAGGDLAGLVNGGKREAAEVRRRLAEAGIEGDKLKQLLGAIEPTRLAHRVDPERVWLYTATEDQVVPFSSASAYQKAAGLSDEHHIQLWGNHYSVIVYFPVIVDHMVARLKAAAEK